MEMGTGTGKHRDTGRQRSEPVDGNHAQQPEGAGGRTKRAAVEVNSGGRRSIQQRREGRMGPGIPLEACGHHGDTSGGSNDGIIPGSEPKLGLFARHDISTWHAPQSSSAHLPA